MQCNKCFSYCYWPYNTSFDIFQSKAVSVALLPLETWQLNILPITKGLTKKSFDGKTLIYTQGSSEWNPDTSFLYGIYKFLLFIAKPRFDTEVFRHDSAIKSLVCQLVQTDSWPF